MQTSLRLTGCHARPWAAAARGRSRGIRCVARLRSEAPVVVTSSPPPAAVRSNQDWHYAVALSALAAMICSIDRAAMSVAVIPMAAQFGWSDSTKGAVNSAFYIGYTATNLIGGYLSSTTSAKAVLGAGVVVWSAFTITTPAAAASSLPLLYGNRALMGAGEGVTFPCVQTIVKQWVPPDVTSRALALIYSGGQLGTIVSLITAPLIINNLGWPSVFIIYGSLGLVWIVAWQTLVSEPPQQQLHRSKFQAAAAAIRQQQQQQQQQLEQLQQQQPPQQQEQPQHQQQQQQLLQQQLEQQLQQQQLEPLQQQQQQQVVRLPALGKMLELPWGEFFTNRAFLALMLTHTAFGVGHYVCLSWLPTYYSQEFGLDVQQSALLSVLPWLLTVVASNAGGWLADYLPGTGRLSLTNTRKLLQTVGSAVPALCLLVLAQQDPEQLTMGTAAALLTATMSLGGFQSAGFAANHQDISSRYASVLFGVTNALSSLAGTASVYATGVILESSGSWAAVFGLVAAFYLAGAAAFVTMASADPQFE